MNLFSGIISTELKQLYSNAISALLYNDSLTLPCKLYYGVTKYESCVNCVYDSIGQKSANRFQDGGHIPFPFGHICPVCHGIGKRAVETTGVLNMMVIWDYKQFVDVGTVNEDLLNSIQTITFAKNTPKIKRVKEIVVATGIASYATHRYERNGEPKPCGLGGTDFVSCLWKKI